MEIDGNASLKIKVDHLRLLLPSILEDHLTLEDLIRKYKEAFIPDLCEDVIVEPAKRPTLFIGPKVPTRILDEHSADFELCLDVLRKNEELRREAAQRKQRLLEASHEMRGPIMALSSHVELIQNAISAHPDVTPSVKNRLERMGQAVQRMNFLACDYLNHAKYVEGSASSLCPEKIKLSRLLARIEEQLEPFLTQKQIRLEIARASDLPQVIAADSEGLFQVIMNLLRNAVKFTPVGGRIELDLRLINETIRFRVSDSGTGIHEADLPYLFEPFWQSDATRHLGTGLGLSIARSIVEKHGGRIWADSPPASGARFFFTLPHSRQKVTI